MSEPRLMPPWIVFEPGARVVMEEGPLKGVSATVLGWDDTPSLTVLVATSSGSIAIDVNPQWVSIDESAMALPKLPVH